MEALPLLSQVNAARCGGRAGFSSSAQRRAEGAKHFGKGGEECGCSVPLARCHVSMGMKEGQEAAPPDCLGGGQGKHLVNKPPPLQCTRLSGPSPGLTPLCPLHSLPLWSWDRAAGLQAGPLVSSPQTGPWQQPLRMSTSLSKQSGLLCLGKACGWRPHSLPYPGCLPHSSAQENAQMFRVRNWTRQFSNNAAARAGR